MEGTSTLASSLVPHTQPPQRLPRRPEPRVAGGAGVNVVPGAARDPDAARADIPPAVAVALEEAAAEYGAEVGTGMLVAAPAGERGDRKGRGVGHGDTTGAGGGWFQGERGNGERDHPSLRGPAGAEAIPDPPRGGAWVQRDRLNGQVGLRTGAVRRTVRGRTSWGAFPQEYSMPGAGDARPVAGGAADRQELRGPGDARAPRASSDVSGGSGCWGTRGADPRMRCEPPRVFRRLGYVSAPAAA